MKSLLKVVLLDGLVLLVAPASVFRLKNVEALPTAPGEILPARLRQLPSFAKTNRLLAGLGALPKPPLFTRF